MGLKSLYLLIDTAGKPYTYRDKNIGVSKEQDLVNFGTKICVFV
jgi:hypothetical protein